jgi:hypothetical protein
MTIKTKLHTYRFNVENEGEAKAYKSLRAQIDAQGIEGRGHWMNVLASPGEPRNVGLIDNSTVEIEIDPSCIFENQWNTADGSLTTNGARVFDHYEGIYPNKKIKHGHWIEITPELYRARKETLKCGYCGKHYGPFHTPAPSDGFCQACLDSPYLKESQIYLTRLLPLVGLQTRDRLTVAEMAEMLPRYVERQTTGADSRAKQKRDKQRADVLKKYDRETRAATEERDGMLWLWDKGFSLENVIYYSHTRQFGFGWQSPVEPSVLSRLLDEISEFPFAYEIKTHDGRNLKSGPMEDAA